MTQKHNLLLTLLLSAILNSLSGQSVPNSTPTQNSVDGFIHNKLNESGIVGLGAAIIVDKRVVWSKGYGFSDKENRIPFSTSTIMNIASISKTFTGVCIMKAVEDGYVALDEDINTYLPFKVVNPNFPDEKITLRHLATHTSSLIDRYPFYTDSTYYYNGEKPQALGEFLKNYFVLGGKHYSKENFLNVKPGSMRDYSNIGAGLAGYIIEFRTGMKLSNYAQTNIFKPLKMNNTGWSISEINLTKHTKLYEKRNNEIAQIPFYEGITYPDGGIRTSVHDLSTFFICLLNDGEYNKSRILKKETAREMLRFQHTDSNKPVNVDPDKLNSGIFWATKVGATRIGHNGSDPGVRTFMLADLKREIGVVIFFNTSLREEEEKTFFEIYEALHKHGIELRNK